METKKLIRTNIVDAAPMTRGEYNKYRGVENAPNENPEEEGYILFYRKGTPQEYVSWCPKEESDRVSRPADVMTFGDAIEALRQGFKVARKGWNGKGMFLWLKEAVIIESSWCKDKVLKRIIDEAGGAVLGLGTICMFTNDSEGHRDVLTGWLASQTDMLAYDWFVVDESTLFSDKQ